MLKPSSESEVNYISLSNENYRGRKASYYHIPQTEKAKNWYHRTAIARDIANVKKRRS